MKVQAIRSPLARIPLRIRKGHIFAKIEWRNPSGSIKDRPVQYMLEDAIDRSVLIPGQTEIIEASSGNQGIAVARASAILNCPCTIVVPEGTTDEKVSQVRAYGAELEFAKPGSIEDPDNYRNIAKRLAEERRSFFVNQYLSEVNPRSYFEVYGPEIWVDTHGKVTHFIAAAGTGGTLCGTARFLRMMNPNIRIIGVDSANSFRSTGGNPRPYKVQGIGVDFLSPTLDNDLVDEWIAVEDDAAFEAMKFMAKKYGFLIGPAAGAVTSALFENVVPKLGSEDIVICPFTDSARSYLSVI